MKYCTSCGYRVPNGENTCPLCGRRVVERAEDRTVPLHRHTQSDKQRTWNGKPPRSRPQARGGAKLARQTIFRGLAAFFGVCALVALLGAGFGAGEALASALRMGVFASLFWDLSRIPPGTRRYVRRNGRSVPIWVLVVTRLVLAQVLYVLVWLIW